MLLISQNALTRERNKYQLFTIITKLDTNTQKSEITKASPQTNIPNGVKSGVVLNALFLLEV